VHRLVASWFGTGLILARLTGAHNGSGTVGAAFAMLIWWALVPVGWWAQGLAALAVSLLAVWSSRPFSGHHADPGWVVVDEAAGALLATTGLVGVPALLAWVVFRFADIRKHLFPGVAAADRLPGPWGITLDDLVAGCYGLAAGWALELVTRS
jgi:phosphatidylglycerophosphatase A